MSNDIIYKTQGEAAEYSHFGLNPFLGCSNQCVYCYNRIGPGANLLGSPDVNPKKNILQRLEKQLQKGGSFLEKDKQVQLTFVSDLYCEGALQFSEIRRGVLELLLKYKVPNIAILTKNSAVLKDIDLFKEFPNIKVGISITLPNEKEQKPLEKWEPKASPCFDRLMALHELYDNDILTWVSFEPVVDTQETLRLVRGIEWGRFVDFVKVGKINHMKGYKDENWKTFTDEFVESIKMPCYIKKSLQKYIDTTKYPSKYFDPYETQK